MTRFNPTLFSWARETAGFALEDGARAVGIARDTLASIEAGEREPSRAMLTSMVKAYRRSLLTFYMAVPPATGDRGQDFRTVVSERAVEAASDLDALVRDIRARQSLVTSVLEDDEDAEPVGFVGTITMGAGVAAVRERMEELLRTTREEYRAQKDVENAFGLLRARAEQQGVFVLLAGNLGSHHSTIPVEAFRGMAISDPLAPFIVINDGDVKPAWSFTLLHELAHLFLGATGVSGAYSEMKIEEFCNDVAASFLVGDEEVSTVNVAALDTAERVALISQLAGQWRVSRQMVAYRLFKLRRMSQDDWKEVSAAIHERWVAERQREKDAAKAKRTSGPSYYVVRRHRLGSALLNFANRAMDAGTLTPAKAARVLGVKPRSVYPLLAAA